MSDATYTYSFEGWARYPSGMGIISEVGTVPSIAPPATFYAVWQKHAKESGGGDTTTYGVKFVLNGGSIGNSTNDRTFTTSSNASKTLKEWLQSADIYGVDPTKSGYTFSGWYTSATGGTKYTESTPISPTANTYGYKCIEAQYTEDYGGGGSETPTTHQVVFYKHTGASPVSITVNHGDTIPNTSVPTLGSWVNDEWTDENGNHVNLSSPVTDDLELHGLWHKDVSFGSTLTAQASNGTSDSSAVSIDCINYAGCLLTADLISASIYHDDSPTNHYAGLKLLSSDGSKVIGDWGALTASKNKEWVSIGNISSSSLETTTTTDSVIVRLKKYDPEHSADATYMQNAGVDPSSAGRCTALWKAQSINARIHLS